MLGPQKYQKVSRFFAATAATPQDRARAVTRVCSMAEKEQTNRRRNFLHRLHANHSGQFPKACSRITSKPARNFPSRFWKTNSSGWAKANSPDIRENRSRPLAESASRKAAESRKPRELAPGHYTAILEPSAVLDLVGFFFYDFAGTAVLDKRSCFTDRMGKKIFGDNITLWDDVYHPLQIGAPYDGEGVPRQKVLLVDRGVPKNLVYSRATAKKMKTNPPATVSRLPNEYGEAPMNLVFSRRRQIRGRNDSLHRARHSRHAPVVHPRSGSLRKNFTGMTRDGTFLVENGRVAGGIRNFRFNQSIIEMLSNVEMLGPAVRAAGEESFEMVVPAMKVRNFHFSEVTKF